MSIKVSKLIILVLICYWCEIDLSP